MKNKTGNKSETFSDEQWKCFGKAMFVSKEYPSPIRYQAI